MSGRQGRGEWCQDGSAISLLPVGEQPQQKTDPPWRECAATGEGEGEGRG